MKKIMLFIIALIPIILITTVQITTNYVEKNHYIAVENVSFEEDYLEIVKSTDDDVVISFPAKVLPVGATNKNVDYFSSDENIAVVDRDGQITFKEFGRVVITAVSKSASAIKDSCEFLVTDTKAHRIEIINKINSLILGEQYYLNCHITPNETIDKNLIYSSSNESVAKVMPDGKIETYAGGTTTITVSTSNGKTDSFNLEVLVPVSKISIEEDKKYIISGQNDIVFPAVTIYPNNATNQKVFYKSSNEQIAEISQEGIISFKEIGSCVFTATTEDGGFSVEFTANYTGGYIISAEIDSDYKNLELNYEDFALNNNFKIPVKNLYPANADLKNVIYETSNQNVIKVSSDGTALEIVGGGNVIITVKIIKQNGEIISIGTSNIFVKRKADEIIVKNGESLVQDNEEIEIDVSSYQIDYQILQPDCTDEITFSSSDTNLAKVTNYGRVIFNRPGNVTITIDVKDKEGVYLSREFVLNYSAAEKEILISSLTPEVITLNYPDEFGFIYDSSLNLTAVEYSITGDSVTFDKDEYVFKTQKGGNSTIVAVSNGVSITINIVVLREVSSLNVWSNDVDLSSKSVTTSKKVVQFNSEIGPEDATTQNATYKVEPNDGVANVDSEGRLTFLKAGTVNVVVSADNISYNYEITSTFGLPTDFVLSETNLTLFIWGENKETATIGISDSNHIKIFGFNPSDYVFSLSDVTFRSEDDAIVTVDENGTVLAQSKGETFIYASINGIEKSILVEVKVKSTEVKFVADNQEVNQSRIIGESIDISKFIVVGPEQANDKSVTYSLSNESSLFASITEQGVLTFLTEGCAEITIKTNDSGVSTVVRITKISSPDILKIYKGETDVSGGNLKVLANDASPILRVVATASNLLDEYNVDLNNITAAFESEETMVISITKDESHAGYFTVARTDEINKSLSTKIMFSYGDTTVSLNIKFYRITGIAMSLDNQDDKNFGLQRTRVFGTYSYVNGARSNTLNVEATALSEGNQDKLYWFSSDEAFVSVNDGVMTFNQIKNGQVTITVGNESSLEDCIYVDSYNFTIVVGLNVTSNESWQNALSSSLGQVNIVLQANLGTDQDKNAHPNQPFDYFYPTNTNFGKDVYGNGFVLNFHNFPLDQNYCMPFYGNVYNVTMKGHDTNESKEYEYIHCLYSGTTMEYCVVQNMKSGLSVSLNNASVYVKNCVVKHTTQYGMLICEEANQTVYIENMIFYDVGMCAVNFQNGTLNIKGFCDVYNFKKYTDFDWTYQSVLKSTYQDSSMTNYVDKSGGTSVGNWVANVAIVIVKIAGTPKVNSINFWDETSKSYIADTDNCTGLSYNKIYKTTGTFILKTHLYLWTPPVSTSYIKYGQNMDNFEDKAYRTL